MESPESISKPPEDDPMKVATRGDCQGISTTWELTAAAGCRTPDERNRFRTHRPGGGSEDRNTRRKKGSQKQPKERAAEIRGRKERPGSSGSYPCKRARKQHKSRGTRRALDVGSKGAQKAGRTEGRKPEREGQAERQSAEKGRQQCATEEREKHNKEYLRRPRMAPEWGRAWRGPAEWEGAVANAARWGTKPAKAFHVKRKDRGEHQAKQREKVRNNLKPESKETEEDGTTSQEK